jgi:hypothetical protein
LGQEEAMAKLSANGTEVARLTATRQDADQTLVQVYSIRSTGVILRRAGTADNRGAWKRAPYQWKSDPVKATARLTALLRDRGYEVS